MFPCLTAYQKADNHIGHAIHAGEVFLHVLSRCIEVSDFAHHIIRQLRVRVLGANHSPTTRPSLPASISHIVLMCPEPKVCRIYAGWVVARMTDAHTIRDWPVTHLIRNAMGTQPTPKSPVSISVLSSSPYPAPIRASRFLHLVPKRFPRCMTRQVAHRATFNVSTGRLRLLRDAGALSTTALAISFRDAILGVHGKMTPSRVMPRVIHHAGAFLCPPNLLPSISHSTRR